MKKSILASALSTALCASPFALMSMAPAQVYAQNEGVKEVNLAAQPLAQALLEVGQIFNVVVVADQKLTQNKVASPVSEQLSLNDALNALLEGTDLTFVQSSSGAIIISTIKEATAPEPQKNIENNNRSLEIETITITGTNIRGTAPESSPFRTFNSEAILATGQSTAQDFVLTIPQNFGGGASDRGLGGPSNDPQRGFNTITGGTLGSSVNLRGLGSGATLVLLNGRRMPLASAIGGFVDVSLFPASAIQRVDVLLDGASSIYGADAVAGVTNFILRDQFDGVKTTFRYGGTADGAMNEYRVSVTAGTDWNSGSVVASYEYFDQGNLDSTSRDFTGQVLSPDDILPTQERHSIVIATQQELTSSLNLDVNLLYGTRDTISFSTEIGQTRIGRPETSTLSGSLGLNWEFKEDWTLDLGATHGYTDSDARIQQIVFGDTGGDTIDDEFFGSDFKSELSTVDVLISGSVLGLPGGDVQLAVGSQARLEDFKNADQISGQITREADRDVYSVFGELFIPIFGSSNAITGFQKLQLSASVRHEDYSDFGGTTNPKIGIFWQPIEQLSFRTSYSTSFTAPPLGQVGAADRSVVAGPLSLINGFFVGDTPPELADEIALYVFGTGDNLDAEESTSWSAGVDFQDQYGQTRVSASLNWFDIDFENRIGTTAVPGFSNTFAAINFDFLNPGVLPAGTVDFNPSSDTVQNLIDTSDFPVRTFADVDPLSTTVINFAPVFRNLAATQIEGIDFALQTQFDALKGKMTFGIDGTYISSFRNANTANSPFVDVVSTLFNPVDLNLRGSIGYSKDGLSTNLFINYTNDYQVSEDPNSATLDDDLTFDVSLIYDFGSHNSSFLNDFSLRVFVLNVFDEEPPRTPGELSFSGEEYDPANASPLERFVAVELSKRF